MRAVEDVYVGEYVMGPDSRPRLVLQTTRGVGPLYKVKQTSGIDYIVNDAHILSLKRSGASAQPRGLLKSGRYRWPNGRYPSWGDVANVDVLTVAAQSKRRQAHFRGYKAGLLQFPTKALPIDPYMLGLWLGDGTSRELSITSMDKEIIDFCSSYIKQWGGEARVKGKENNKAKFIVMYAREGRVNPLWQKFRELGLANNKHIPDIYQFNSESARLQLLAGLIDTDGSKSKNNYYTITQVNGVLARQIKYLADGLGFRTSIRKSQTNCNGVIGQAFRVAISGDAYRIPCKIARKIIRAEDIRRNKDHLLSQVALEPMGVGEYAGFALDGDHLFLLEDGTVTHNSWAFAEALIRRAAYSNARVLCTREYQNSIKDSVHRILSDTIYRLGLGAWFVITDKTIRSKMGAEFLFKGLHANSTEIKSTEGIDIVWVAEAQNTADASWRDLIPTIRKSGSEIWIEFNVTDEEAPTHKRFIANDPSLYDITHDQNHGQDTAKCFIRYKVNYTENPFLSAELQAEMEYDKANDYEAYEHIWLGFPKTISDAVVLGGRYREMMFADDLYLEAPRLHFGADFGYARDPNTLNRSFILDKKLYVEYEAYGLKVELEDMEEFYAGSEDNGLTPRRFDGIPLAKNWPIKGDSARPETISFMRGKGFNMHAAEKWNGSVEDGIAYLRGFKEIIIHPRCKHTLREARLWSFKTDRQTGEVLPVLIDKHNHTWDGIRYGLDGYIQRSGDIGIWERLGAKKTPKRHA